MPIYEYECDGCKNTIEVQQKMSDDPLVECPDCKGKLRKIISSNSFQLKGGGWYSDGYSSTSKSKCSDGASSGGCSGCQSSD